MREQIQFSRSPNISIYIEINNKFKIIQSIKKIYSRIKDFTLILTIDLDDWGCLNPLVNKYYDK